MIKRWKISNFKSIREPVDLAIEPLTIFCGPNSSGKSTVLKSILAVSQSLSSSMWEEPLVLNGRLINLGPLEEVFHHGCESDPIDLGFTVQAHLGELITVDAAIEGISVRRGRQGKQTQARVQFCELRAETLAGETEVIGLRNNPISALLQPDEISRASAILRRQIEHGLFDFDIIRPRRSDLIVGQGKEEIIGSSVSNFLPGRMLMRVNTEIRDVIQELRQITDAILTLRSTRAQHDRNTNINWNMLLSRWAKLAFARAKKSLSGTNPYRNYEDRNRYIMTLDHIADPDASITIQFCVDQLRQIGEKGRSRELDNLVSDLTRRLNGSIPEIQETMLANKVTRQRTDLEVVLFPAQYAQITERVRQVLGNRVHYIGPLRDDPRVIYAIPQEAYRRDVGLKGEYTAAMLDAHAEREVEYPLPPKISSEPFSGEYVRKHGSLNEAVQVWLQRMGLADGVDASETKKVGYRLNIRPEGLDRDLDLMSVGVGVSQVLPTIVMALLAPRGSILIFEQPEVHLHPKVQSILGDFFLGIVACGKQCLVETHSEHLINRIRRRIAESRDTTILSQFRLYFVERQDAISRFMPVEPNEYGAIPKWPKGFFDEVEEEASLIMQAASDKRHERRAQKRPNEKE